MFTVFLQTDNQSTSNYILLYEYLVNYFIVLSTTHVIGLPRYMEDEVEDYMFFFKFDGEKSYPSENTHVSK